jgi:hypothetical protein
MCDETIFRLFNSHYPRLKKTFNFTHEGLNRALSAKAGPCTGQNDYGLYYAKFQTECPYSGDKRRVSFILDRLLSMTILLMIQSLQLILLMHMLQLISYGETA